MFVGGWIDGFRIVMSVPLTIALIALLAAALFTATVLPIWRRRRNTVEGHRVDWH